MQNKFKSTLLRNRLLKRNNFSDNCLNELIFLRIVKINIFENVPVLFFSVYLNLFSKSRTQKYLLNIDNCG